MTGRSSSATRRRRGRRGRARRGTRRRRPAPTARSASIPALGQIGVSWPPIVVNDVIIVGNSHIHGYYPIRLRNLPSYIRGFDVRTGKQLWKFNLVPEPGEFGADTWVNGTKVGTPGVGKVDAWAPYSADPDLGLVYIPVGMPLMDEYGGHRPGNNLFGNSLVALDVKTGKRKWHYQMVHHDIWDYDAPMAPNLLDVTIDGRPRKIVVQSSKQGWLYVFDRVNGEPIWPIVETPVLQSEVPGEQASPTQPIPTKPAPYAQQGLVEADSDRLHAGDQGSGAEAGEGLPHGAVLHSGLARRRLGAERVDVLVVCAWRQRRREHRWRRRGRSRDRACSTSRRRTA